MRRPRRIWPPINAPFQHSSDRADTVALRLLSRSAPAADGTSTATPNALSLRLALAVRFALAAAKKPESTNGGACLSR